MIYKRTKAKYILLVVGGVITYFLYIVMSDIYPLLPPLMGILFLIFHQHYNEEKFYIPIVIIGCLFFYEFDKALLTGIIPCVFFIVQLFIAQQLESILLVNAFFILIYICALYLLYFAGLLLCNILFKTPMLAISSIYIYYLIMDCIFAILYYYIFIKE